MVGDDVLTSTNPTTTLNTHKDKPSSSNTTSESESPQALPPPSPQSPTGVRLPLTIHESQPNTLGTLN